MVIAERGCSDAGGLSPWRLHRVSVSMECCTAAFFALWLFLKNFLECHQWRCWPRAINWPVLFVSPITPSPVCRHSSALSSKTTVSNGLPSRVPFCNSPIFRGPFFFLHAWWIFLSHGIWGHLCPTAGFLFSSHVLFFLNFCRSPQK